VWIGTGTIRAPVMPCSVSAYCTMLFSQSHFISLPVYKVNSAFMHAVCFCPARDARRFLPAAPGQARVSPAMPPAVQDGERIEEAPRPAVKGRAVVHSQSVMQGF
jgi:hypothetical protein